MYFTRIKHQKFVLNPQKAKNKRLSGFSKQNFKITITFFDA